MAGLALACSVRECGLRLERAARTFVCARGHSYDIARSGYVNLLQPQDRKSRSAGDAKAAVDARARLLRAGVGRTIVDRLVERASRFDLPVGATVVDLGSGSGEALAALARQRSIAAIGIDLSTAAADRAARAFPDVLWVVANADRRLPLLDASSELLLSLHGRRNPAECARVLNTDGHLLIGIPAHDDLIELRALVQGDALARDRTDALLREHEPLFTLVERFSAREQHHLERDALLLLLRGTYRGERGSAADRVRALDRLDVTLASEFFVFRPRRANAA